MAWLVVAMAGPSVLQEEWSEEDPECEDEDRKKMNQEFRACTELQYGVFRGRQAVQGPVRRDSHLNCCRHLQSLSHIGIMPNTFVDNSK